MRDFAKRLIAYETKGNRSAVAKPPLNFPVCEKLRPHLATLIGKNGFHALFSRSLALASAEVSWLRALHMKTDGSLAGLEELHPPPNADEWLEGRVVLLAQLLGLLVAFIGENLTFRLVREIWPKVRLNDLDFGNGGKK